MIPTQFPDQRSTHERPKEPASPLKIRSRRGDPGRENGPDSARAPKSRTRARKKGRRSSGGVGAAGFGRLASVRDRKRVTERNAEERVRVEEMLAKTPLSTERRSAGRPNVPARTRVDRGETVTPVTHSVPEPLAIWKVARPAIHSAIHSTIHSTGCPVCASSKVTTDDVFQTGATLRLSECLICDHRWTERRHPQPWRRFAEAGARMSRSSQAVRNTQLSAVPQVAGA